MIDCWTLSHPPLPAFHFRLPLLFFAFFSLHLLLFLSFFCLLFFSSTTPSVTAVYTPSRGNSGLPYLGTYTQKRPRFPLFFLFLFFFSLLVHAYTVCMYIYISLCVATSCLFLITFWYLFGCLIGLDWGGLFSLMLGLRLMLWIP